MRFLYFTVELVRISWFFRTAMPSNSPAAGKILKILKPFVNDVRSNSEFRISSSD